MLLNVVYTFSGCDSPVSATGSIDDAKAGDAIPLKFSLGVDNGLSVVSQTTWRGASCADWSGVGAGTIAHGRLSYNASLDRHVDLIATDPSWKRSCRIIDLTLDDGSHHTIRVRFTR